MACSWTVSVWRADEVQVPRPVDAAEGAGTASIRSVKTYGTVARQRSAALRCLSRTDRSAAYSVGVPAGGGGEGVWFPTFPLAETDHWSITISVSRLSPGSRIL